MPDVKSIIDIVVNDEKFKAFQAQFNKYQEQLKGQGAAWDKSNQAMKGANAQFKSIADLSNSVAGNLQKAVKNQDGLRKGADKTNLSMEKLVRTTGHVTKNILGATTALLKWSGIATAIGGLLGAGGLFGIDRLAAGAAADRRESLGTGASIGQLRAFKADFSRLVDPEAMLQSVFAAQHSAAGLGKFAALGIPTGVAANMSPTDLAIAVMQRVHGMYQHGGLKSFTADQMKAYGLDQFLNLGDVERIGKTDVSALAARYRRNVPRFGLTGATGLAYQNLQTTLGEAGAGIETTFQRSLVGLAPGLERLSTAVEHAIGSFMRSGAVKDAIGDLAKGIRTFADYLTSPSFANDMDEFLETMQKILAGFKSLLSLLPGVDMKPSMGLMERKAERSYGLPLGTLEKFRSTILPAGGYGLQSDYGNQSSMVASILKDPARMRPQAIRAFLETLIGGENFQQMRGSIGHPGDRGYAARMNYYNSVEAAVDRGMSALHITVQNNTGGNASITTNAMAPAR